MTRSHAARISLVILLTSGGIFAASSEAATAGPVHRCAGRVVSIVAMPGCASPGPEHVSLGGPARSSLKIIIHRSVGAVPEHSLGG